MGWLRDLMETADPPVRSFNRLAAAAKKSPDWPVDSDVQDRSLATLLSRLDRGQDLSWLADRHAVQVALARTLGVPLDPIRQALGERLRAQPESHLLRLRDLPAARPLDLERDELPPGLPIELLAVPTEPLWWLAESGSGRTLLGRWLAARGRASFLEREILEPAELPAGPCFVELSSSTLVGAPYARQGLAVAASFAPPPESGFRVVRAPPAAEVLGPLSAWAHERLPADSRFEPRAARDFLQQRISAGHFRTLGELLGVVGLIDELGLREVAGRSFDKLAQRFVEQRLAKSLDPALPFAGWLRRSLYPALVGMAERALVDAESRLEEPKRFESWLGLVPPELERNVELEWMRLSLSQVDSGIRPSDLERAARKLPPGAFRIVASLETAGLLRRRQDDRLQLSPTWLRAHLQRKAISAVLLRSPFEWGEALLRPHAAAELADALLERVLTQGGSALEPVLDLDAEDQPAYAAAVDLALRVAGVGRLLGAELSQELLAALWRENAGLVLELGESPPLPRIELSTAERRAEHRRGDLLLQRGTFYLAALSVSELIDEPSTRRMRALDPWRQSRPSAALPAIYDCVWESLAGGSPWGTAAFALVQRIRASIGNVRGPDDPHTLELPAQVLEEAEHGVLAFEGVERLYRELAGLTPLLELARERHVPRNEVARAIWSAWDQAERPDSAPFLAPGAAEHALFWSSIPAALLENLLIDARRGRIPYAVFGDEQWDAYARALERAPELVTESEAWRAMPAALVTRVLALPLAWQRAPEPLAILWQRFPELLGAATERQLRAKTEADPDVLAALLSSAPDERAGTLLDELEERSATLSAAARTAVRLWLHGVIARRSARFREAYRALARLERSSVPL